MGNCSSGDVDPISQSIDFELNQEKRALFHTNFSKILLLGAGESGKSTFAKQLRRMYDVQFTEEEIQNYKLVVYENVLYSLKNMIAAISGDGDLKFREENNAKVEEIRKYEDFDNLARIGAYIKDLIHDPAITEAFKLYQKIHLLDSTRYYFDNIDRILQENYKPNDEDIVRSRTKTTGIQETKINLSSQEILVIIDVGGQRSERRKWVMCFDNQLMSIIFFTSMNEYDFNLYEDRQTNRMLESLQLFSDICVVPMFRDLPLILFLNKMDLFEEKIKENKNITPAFPDYDGPCDIDSCKLYIQEKFTNIAVEIDNTRTLFCHETTAIDKNKLMTVWESLSKIFISSTVKNQIGLEL